MNRCIGVIFVAILVVGGCAPQRGATRPAGAATERAEAEWMGATSRPDARSFLALDEILPKPVLAAAPEGAEDRDPPTEALVLYAKGMEDLFNQHPYDAVEVFLEALRADPNSYELYYELGRAHLDRLHQPNDRAFDAFEHAAALRPDDLQVQLLLGREYLADGKIDKATEHLRLALQTSEYRENGAGAAAVDFFLARALQEQGYDRAALDEYTILANKLNNATQELGRDPDVGFLLSSPDLIWVQIGNLYEKHGQYADALAAYEPLAKYDPANFGLQAKVVRMLARLGREDDATQEAADLVARFRASGESVQLLRDVYRLLGREQDVAHVLRRLHERHPEDRGILFALSDCLVEEKKFDEAIELIRAQLAKKPGDEELLEKVFDLYVAHDDIRSAARALIVYLAGQPDSLREVLPLWDELVRPARKSVLHVADLQKLDVSAGAAAVKLYFVSRVADLWQRDALARSSLQQAVKVSPPFAPAYRELVGDIWERGDFDVEQKRAATNDLAQAAQDQGAQSLAEEVRGLSALAEEKLNDAAGHFLKAKELGADSPDFQLVYASVLRRQGDTLTSQQILWALVAKRPRYDEAWESLYGYYDKVSKDADALKVLAEWLKADPASAAARLRQVWWYAKQGQLSSAQQLQMKILEDHPDQIQVLQAADEFYKATGQSDLFLQKLEEIHQRQPQNFLLLSWLVNDYMQAHRAADAGKLLDDSRAKAGNDAELLYQLSGMYERIGQTQVSQDLLEGIIKADPTNGSASNDLGFAWADAGKNLERAEQLIRVAVNDEPDNQAFLDSLGWVLYKRGKFDEAAKYMQLAIGPAALPDPEILDHYGDILYRQGKTGEAQKQWQRALDRLGQENAERTGAGELRTTLKKKLEEAAAGKAVDTARVVENPSSAVEAPR